MAPLPLPTLPAVASLPSLALDLPLDDAIDILKRRQGHYTSPALPPATPLKSKDLPSSSSSFYGSTTSWSTCRASKESSRISQKMPSRQRAIQVLKAKNLLVSSSAPRLPVAARPIREDVVEQAPLPTEEAWM
eukprot:Skav211766  [mRNA]  locus=scaffold674:432402:446560:+ [translate_table: standard]